jgi:hypothetical protein
MDEFKVARRDTGGNVWGWKSEAGSWWPSTTGLRRSGPGHRHGRRAISGGQPADVADLSSLLKKRAKVGVKFVSGGMVYGFQAGFIECLHTHHIHLLILTYPERTSTYELRKEKRTDSYSPATLSVGELGFSGSVSDMSPSGCRFVFAVATKDHRPAMRLGETATRFLRLPEFDASQIFPCRIKNIRHDGQSLSLGLTFDLHAEAKFSMEFFRRFLEEQNPD